MTDFGTQPSGESAHVEQWEYHIIHGAKDSHVLNNYGRFGWELVGVAGLGSGIGASLMWVFKRRIATDGGSE